MVVIDVSLSSLFFFMLGFFAAVAMIVLLAIVWVLFPKLSEAKRFFDFWRKIKDNKKV
ncbi:MAG: hypothetical protein J4445_01115 [DPANN group archaeon]|nr:hypothetical protein [DPANN group archaeon]